MEGVDLGRVEPWLRSRLPDARPPFRLRRLAGGRSNLTYLLTDAGGGEWVLRRPPLGPRQATAHDVLREGRIIDALAPTGVPVPAVLGSGAAGGDGDPLLLVERAPGVSVGDPGAARGLAPEARRRAGIALAKLLAARVPAQTRTAIVHGDYRLDNCLLDPAGEVTGGRPRLLPRLRLVEARLHRRGGLRPGRARLPRRGRPSRRVIRGPG